MIFVDSRYLFAINGAVLVGCAIFDFAWRDRLLFLLMLLLPFLDRRWSIPKLVTYNYRWAVLSILLAPLLSILITNPAKAYLVLYMLLLVALPEEWFFRAYFMQRLEAVTESRWVANAATSVLFAALHVPSQGWYGLMTFLPSLVLGWVYQRQKDLLLVVLIHAAANLVYSMYLRQVV